MCESLQGILKNIKTGELIFTQYPPRGTQPCHVTLFLEAGASGDGRKYVHAGAETVEISNAESYSEGGKSSGFLHARAKNSELAGEVADVAKRFASTVQRTPYGKQFGGDYFRNLLDARKMDAMPEKPNSSRFAGMIKTKDFDAIPFELPSLRRLLKWTLRFRKNETLSKNRGVTCAAFVSICYQVAGMHRFLKDANIHDNKLIEKCIQVADKLLLPKEKNKLPLVHTLPGGKVIYKDQALREHSNRLVAPEIHKINEAAYLEKRGNAIFSAENPYLPASLSSVELYWFNLQTRVLNLDVNIAGLLANIIHKDFYFDAKYVNSLILVDRIQKSTDWEKTVCNKY